MERHFYRRGRRITVTEMEGILAVQSDERARGAGAVPENVGELATDAAGTDGGTLGIPDEEASGLARAGWLFVRPSEPVARALESRDMPDQVNDVASVFQQEDGHVLIGSRTLTVQVAPEMSDQAARTFLEDQGVRIVRSLTFAPNQFEVEVPVGADLLEVANALQESDDTIFAEPMFVEFIGQRLRPSDPAYPQQWHLNNTGDDGGTEDADIFAEEAWDFTRGEGVRLAVIDNGFDVTHPDLKEGIVAESGFFDSSQDFRQTLTGFPDGDHGTFCAGMAAARHNNGVDGCGSAPAAELILIAPLQDQTGTQTTLARAVAYAADPSTEVDDADPATGAHVISSSLGPNGANWALTSVLENAIIFATKQGRQGLGTPIFWASSNGTNVDTASDEVISHPDVIAVGRSRRTDLEDDSARGEELDFLAPGVDVVSTASGGGTRTDTGCSFAAPLAAGVGALVISVNRALAAREIRAIMHLSCDKIGGVDYQNAHHLDYGCGRVNAHRAVLRAIPPWPGRFLRQPPPMNGRDVRQWQQQMTVRGHELVVDGVYGPGSEQACRALQQDLDLTVDGVVGPLTWQGTWKVPVDA